MLIEQLGHDQFRLVGNLPIYNKQFFRLWKHQFKRELTSMYDEYLNDSNDIEKMNYDLYSIVMFQNAPFIIENNLS